MSRKIAALPLALFAFAVPATAAKLAVERERMVNLSGKGDVWNLFDEQGVAGDPKAGTGGKPTTEYTAGWIKAVLHYPIEGVVDLGVEHALTDVWFYDINGSDSIRVSCGDGKLWTTMIDRTTSGYNAWVGAAAPCTGRYVKIRLKSPSSAVTEMVVYGTANGNPEPLPVSVKTAKPTMGELMGLNGFIDDDRSLLAAVGNLREYHSWQWDDGDGDATTPAYPANRFGWSPSWVRGTGWGWNFDEYYQDLSSKGMSMQPVFQGSPAWMFGKAVGDSLKPFPLGRDSSLPASYVEHADYMYQFAARFGRTKHSASDLRVDAMNTATSGAGSVDWMEPWNEPDKDWKGLTGYFSPHVLAAMSSADYDGDQGRMGAKVGVKNGDPTMKMALPGLIGIVPEYVKSMKFWADVHRDGAFPADALNFHHYCTDGGGQGAGEATTGISPEADGLRAKLENLAAWRDRYLPGKELWLSEFGWDTHQGSVFRAPATAGNDGYEMQARWLVRAYLEIAASGFQKAHMFMLRDTWDSSPGVFATSGLVHDKYDTLSPKYEKKVSWWYVNTLHKRLGNYRFESDMTAGSVKVYKFRNSVVSDSVAYVVWNPDDKAVAAQFTLPGVIAGSLREIHFAQGEALGVERGSGVLGGPYSIAALDGRPVMLFGKDNASSTGSMGVRETTIKRDRFGIDGRRIRPDGLRGRILPPAPVFAR